MERRTLAFVNNRHTMSRKRRNDGPVMLLLAPFFDKSVWRRDDLARDESWIITLSEEEQSEALKALDTVSRVPLERITAQSFPLPKLAPRLDGVIDEIEGGRGVVLLRNAPVERLTIKDAERMFWGLACHIGYPERQDRDGARLHHVRAQQSFTNQDNIHKAFSESSLRGYQTNIELTFHSDGSDALMFLCKQPARAGGYSRVASAGAAFNALLEVNPEFAAALQQPIGFDLRAEPLAERQFQLAPVFCFHQNRLNVLYKRGYIELAQRHLDAPRLTTMQIEAMNALDIILADPAFHYEFLMRPGDIEIANNYSVLHARTAFENYEDPLLERHMLRIWATLRRNRRPMPPAYAQTREFSESYLRRRWLGDFSDR